MTTSDAFKQLTGFHHIGMAVKSFDASMVFYRKLGYEIQGPIIDPLQNVELMLLESTTFPRIELIKPIDEKSPVNNYLKGAAEAIYHLCYEVADLSQTLAFLEANHRIICLSQPKPAVLFGGRRVSFYQVKGVGMIELLEK